MSAGGEPPTSPFLSVCAPISPILPGSPPSLLCVCKFISLGFVHFFISFLYFHLPSFLHLLPSQLPPSLSIFHSLGVYFRLHLTPYLSLIAPFIFLHLCPHLPFFSFSSLLACVTIFPPVCLPPSACVSLHFFPQLSPRTLFPRPKGILVLNLDRLRYCEKLQPQEPRQPPGWSFAPPPTTSPYLFQRVACREIVGGGCQLQETEVWGKN